MQNQAVIIRPRLIDDGAGGTESHPDGPLQISTACSFTPVRELPPGPLRDQVIEHGKYLLTVPLTKVVLVTDEIEVLGTTYRATWAPPPDAFAVERLVALEEA